MDKVDCLKNKIVEFDRKYCPKCGTIFADRSGLYNHTKNNTCGNKYKKIRIKTAKEEDTDGKINIDRVNINININIAPSFLKYDTAEVINKLCPDAIGEAFDHIQTSMGIQNILKQTTFNTDHPIFNSIYMENKDDKYVKVSDGHQYVDMLFQDAIKDIVCNKMNILKSELPKFKHLKSPEEYTEISELCDHYGFIYQCAPNFPDFDPEASTRLEIYNEILPEIADMCVQIGGHVKSEEWLKKLTNDLKVVEEFMNSAIDDGTENGNENGNKKKKNPALTQ